MSAPRDRSSFVRTRSLLAGVAALLGCRGETFSPKSQPPGANIESPLADAGTRAHADQATDAAEINEGGERAQHASTTGLPDRIKPTDPTLGRDLEDAFAARRRDGVTPEGTARMLALRSRAETLEKAKAEAGMYGRYVAKVANGLRILTGEFGATVLDSSTTPVGWFDINEEQLECPRCAENSLTVFAVPIAQKIVALLPMHYGREAFLVDVEKMLRVLEIKSNLALMVTTPDGERMFASSEFRYDPDVCKVTLTGVAPTGKITVHPPLLVPVQLCGLDVAWWAGNRFVATVPSSERSITINPRANTFTVAETVARYPKSALRRNHSSRALCGAELSKVRATACSVAQRWVFPPEACADASALSGYRREYVESSDVFACSPEFRRLGTSVDGE